jgi:hypothetical protein
VGFVAFIGLAIVITVADISRLMSGGSALP